MQFRSRSVIPFRPRTDYRLRLPGKLSPEIRIAQISGGPEFVSVQHFPRERWTDLTEFKPDVLVGYAFDLERLAIAADQGTVTLGKLGRAIFVLTDCGTRTLKNETRDLLWRTFGVPILELIIAPGSRLLAAECEAHEGWHLQTGGSATLVDGELVCDAPPLVQSRTGFAGRIESTLCGCGRPSPRLLNLQPYAKPRPRAHANHADQLPLAPAPVQGSPELLPAS